ncbi:MAG: MTH938/NDUFAF3 family protein [Minisyncoccales bacterium]
MIEEYHFGSITINGQTYQHDVEVRWTGEVLEWRFRQRHLIDVEEVKRAVEEKPDTIIIGHGESGLAEVTPAAQEFIKQHGIELILDWTESAIKTFNLRLEKVQEEGKKEKIIGLFHLTC